MSNPLVPLIKRLSELQTRRDKIDDDIANVIDRILMETEKQVKKTPDAKNKAPSKSKVDHPIKLPQ